MGAMPVDISSDRQFDRIPTELSIFMWSDKYLSGVDLAVSEQSALFQINPRFKIWMGGTNTSVNNRKRGPITSGDVVSGERICQFLVPLLFRQ
ncbi:hypothetical protein SG26_19935 (plasmid) [Haloarcula sp. CBA1115]|nr:hypothetical protein SG26_19935 [Haloarcula sp. CBA1115]